MRRRSDETLGGLRDALAGPREASAEAPVPPSVLPPATYPATYSKQQFIRMDDGVELGATITFPSQNGSEPAPGRFPVVLNVTPYGRDGACACESASVYATRGFVLAVLDVRGTGGSQGNLNENYFSPREAKDGYDAVEWAAAQPWSTGKVGTMGTSYMAATQSAAATLNPPHLAAMFVTEGPSNYYRCSMRHNGALEQRFLIYAFHMAVTSPEARANPGLRLALLEARNNLGQWLKRLPLKRGATPLSARRVKGVF